MNGLALKQEFLAALSRGAENMVNVGLREIWTKLDQVARIFATETRALSGQLSVVTVAGEQAYDLDPQFVAIRPLRFLTGSGMSLRQLGRYTAEGVVSWPVLASFERIFAANCAAATSRPGCFAIVDKQEPLAFMSGTVTETGAVVMGEAELVDAGADFSALAPRDTVINTSRHSSGVVLEVLDGQRLKTALFPEGINSWRAGDGYLIQPQARKQVYLSAPAAVDGHVLTLPCSVLPAPVYSELGAWRLDAAACVAIAHEAAFLHAMTQPGLKAPPAHHQLFVNAVQTERFRAAERALKGI